MIKLLARLFGSSQAASQPIYEPNVELPKDGIIRAPEAEELPNAPDSASTIGSITFHIQAGAQVTVGQRLADLETDQFVVEISSPCTGVVRELLVGNGEAVNAGQPLIQLDIDSDR